MKENQTKKTFLNKNRGEVMLVMVILFMMVSLIIIFGVINPTLRNIKTANNLFHSKQSLFLSDSGVADAIYRIKNNLQISNQELLTLDNNFSTTTILDTMEGKTVKSSGNYFDYNRNIETKILKGTGVSFFYGVQIGNGGLDMGGGTRIVGNVYSSGDVHGDGSDGVTGSVVAAGPYPAKIYGDGGDKFDIGGDAWANRVIDTQTVGIIYCNTGSGNNKNCNTSKGNPPVLDMPVTEEMIAGWKEDALAGGTQTGNLTVGYAGATLGPKKIVGDLLVNGGGTLTITGTIWVTGKITVNGGGKMKLASQYSYNSGVVITDKYVTISGGGSFAGSGQTGSYPMLLSTSDCPVSTFCSGNNAISLSGGAGAVILNAQNGTIKVNGGSAAREITGKRVIIDGGGDVIYDAGLANQVFSSGPSGGYQVTSFKETE